jgi:hypothetical protein
MYSGMRLRFGIKALEGNMSLNKRRQYNAGRTIFLASFIDILLIKPINFFKQKNDFLFKRPQNTQKPLMKLSEFFSNLQITEKPVRQPEKSQKAIKPDVYYLQIHEFKFEQISLSFFKINWIDIEGIVYKPKSNSEVLYFIYEFLDDPESIKKHTVLKIRDGKFKTAGFVHREELDISIQGCTSDRTLLEIFTQIVAHYLTAFIDFTADGRHFLINHHPL